MKTEIMTETRHKSILSYIVLVQYQHCCNRGRRKRQSTYKSGIYTTFNKLVSIIVATIPSKKETKK